MNLRVTFKKFVLWYKSYYFKRKTTNRITNANCSEIFLFPYIIFRDNIIYLVM